MTVQLKLPGVTFTGVLPVVRIDSILPVAGALMLVDPTHPASPWAAGAPANGATVPNIAWAQASAAIGSGSQSSLAASIYSVGLTSTAGLVERTTKGGLHGIISPTFSFTDATVGVNVALPQAIKDYTTANPTHKYYFSMWHRVTRAALADGNAKIFSSISTDAQQLEKFSYSQNSYGTLDTANTIDDTVGGNRFRNIAATPGASYGTDTNDVAGSYTPGLRSVFLVGNRHPQNSVSARRGKGGSRILYRAYLEDLTVSGRSYATVNALDSALYAAACNTVGGRYYGDTFTDPATIT